MAAGITKAFALPARIADMTLDIAPHVTGDVVTGLVRDAHLVRGQYTSAINAMAGGADASTGAALFSTLRTQLASAGTRHTMHARGGLGPLGEITRASDAAAAVSTALRNSGVAPRADLLALRGAVSELVDRAAYRAAHGGAIPG